MPVEPQVMIALSRKEILAKPYSFDIWWRRMRVFFFFSSRRRHTRFDCDWSSDVCSSDLLGQDPDRRRGRGRDARHHGDDHVRVSRQDQAIDLAARRGDLDARRRRQQDRRSEEHTSELQSQSNLVCRLLLEKKKNKKTTPNQRHPLSHPSESSTRYLVFRLVEALESGYRALHR